jgi:hypothetical protein
LINPGRLGGTDIKIAKAARQFYEHDEHVRKFGMTEAKDVE